MKKAFSLLELIFVIFISSTLLIYTFKYIQELRVEQVQNQKIASLKIDLNSTKIILEKNTEDIKKQLYYDGKTLYFKGSILLKDVTSFTIKSESNILTINITVNNKINQIWKFKKH